MGESRAIIGGARPSVRRLPRGSLALAALGAACAAAGPVALPHASAVLGPPPLRSASGRCAVYTDDRVAGLVLLRWADETIAEMDRLTGLPQRFDRRSIQIVVNADTNAPGQVRIRRHRVGRWLYQQLYFDHFDAVDRDAADAALGRLLLEGYVLECAGDAASAPRIPDWLVAGALGNFDPARRAVLRDQAVARWKRGELATATSVLRLLGEGVPDAKRAAAPGPDAAAASLIVGWLAAQPERGAAFSRLFAALGQGAPVTAGLLATLIPGCATPADAEESWDRWMLDESRALRLPGTALPEQVAALKAELRLWRGERSIPGSGNDAAPLSMEALIAARREPWVPGLVAAKCARLRAVGLGRGAEFGSVVEAWCGVFEALGGDASDRRLEERVAEARRGLENLEQGAGRAYPGPGGGGSGGEGP